VTRFAQVYLQNLEDLIHKITQYEYCRVYSNYLPELLVYNCDIRKGRELLNESLYRCMVEKTAQRQIRPLALYILAVAQNDGSEEVFFRYINYSGWILPPHYFKGFKKGAEMFGDPNFIHKDSVAKFIGSSSLKRARNAAAAAVKMITELRYAMAQLAQYPILVDTGQYQPKYQNRTFADMENEISRDLTQQPNFQAKVKLLSGEHVIRTKDSPPGLTGKYLEARIEQITEQTRLNYCKPRAAVEEEIRQRQERLKAVENKPNPTSAKATQPQRTRRRTAEETPPAWS
jgi:hypothetical protein